MTEVSSVWDGEATVGEGPVWDAQRKAVWFVDIRKRQVHCYDPVTDSVESWTAPALIGWIYPSADGSLVAGLQGGLARFDPADGSFSTIAEVEADLPANRLNDAAVGPDGSVWFCSLDDTMSTVAGRFYRWDGEHVEPLALDPLCMTNGPALSPDGRLLYYVDTLGGAIHAATLDADGAVIATREFARVDQAEGYPDGCSVDSAGNVWVGLWDGWKARLYAPDGTVLRDVKFPVANVTKIALGGEDLKTAYATTARAGLSEDQLARQPQAGSLFRFTVDVPGQPVPLAKAAVPAV